MAVIAASSITKSGATISGNIRAIVIVKTRSRLRPGPGARRHRHGGGGALLVSAG
jgi:hypothetical protein